MEGLRNRSRKMEMEQSVLASRMTAACEEDREDAVVVRADEGAPFGVRCKKKLLPTQPQIAQDLSRSNAVMIMGDK
jgi:hypothetical protein